MLSAQGTITSTALAAASFILVMEQRAIKNVNNYLKAYIYSYLKTCGGQSFNLYLSAVHFLTPVLIKHLWQLKTIVFLHMHY